MGRKADSVRTPSPGAFDGRKVRSALKWKILGTLLGRVAAPMAAAQLYEFIRRSSARSLGEWLHRVRHPSHVYVYLRRMAEEGLVTLDRLTGALDATLTEKGRTELERYSDYWKERGVPNPEALGRKQRKAMTGAGTGRKSPGRTPPSRGKAVGPQESGEQGSGPGPKSSEQPSGRTGHTGRTGTDQAKDGTRLTRAAEREERDGMGRNGRDGPAALAAQCKALVRSLRAGGRPEGFGGSMGFVSYDLPMAEHGRRRRLLAVLQAAGYAPVHASMYAGPGHALKPVIQTLESAGFVPHLRWGSLRLMNR